MHDQRIEPGPVFYLKNFDHHRRVKRIARQAVHRFGRHGHQLPREQKLPGFFRVGTDKGLKMCQIHLNLNKYLKISHKIRTKTAIQVTGARLLRRNNEGLKVKTGGFQLFNHTFA